MGRRGLGFKREMEKYLPRVKCPREKKTTVTTRVLGRLNQLKLIKRPDKEFRQGFIGAPAIAGREENNFLKERRAGSFLWGEVMGCFQGVGVGGALRWFAHPCWRMCVVPCFCSWLFCWEVAVGLFGLFVSYCPEFGPKMRMHAVIFSSS